MSRTVSRLVALVLAIGLPSLPAAAQQTPVLLVYRVAWETEAIAEAFAQAYAGLLEKKYPARAGKASRTAASVWAWRDGPQGFLVERRGVEVLVLERVPSTAVEPIRRAVLSSP